MVFEFLKNMSPGEVKVLASADIPSALSMIERSALTHFDDFKVVSWQWNKIPGQRNIVNEILIALTDVSLSLWPSWYSEKNLFYASNESYIENQILNLFEIDVLKREKKEVCIPWLKAAVKACQANKPPRFKHFNNALQLAQLALAIHVDNLFLLLCINDVAPEDYRLLGIARATTWVAKESHARVIVLLPEQLADHTELDSIRYGAVFVPQSALLEIGETIHDEPGLSSVSVWPIKGRPHPFSPGEQALAKKLATDSELGMLFSFNQTVHTVRDNSYLVDLLWSEGQIVVEVDGYRHHGNRYGFQTDRHRDYELLISGYLVLRLPHDDVVNDVEVAVEKIRDVVRFRRSQRLT